VRAMGYTCQDSGAIRRPTILPTTKQVDVKYFEDRVARVEMGRTGLQPNTECTVQGKLIEASNKSGPQRGGNGICLRKD